MARGNQDSNSSVTSLSQRYTSPPLQLSLLCLYGLACGRISGMAGGNVTVSHISCCAVQCALLCAKQNASDCRPPIFAPPTLHQCCLYMGVYTNKRAHEKFSKTSTILQIAVKSYLIFSLTLSYLEGIILL
jgi:hypothetical protein